MLNWENVGENPNKWQNKSDDIKITGESLLKVCIEINGDRNWKKKMRVRKKGRIIWKWEIKSDDKIL